MTDLHLHFCGTSSPDLALETGIRSIGRVAGGLGAVAADGPWLLQISHDRRGLWLTVAEGLRGVHVNGRPVQHMALLRAGDRLHVEGQELLLRTTAQPPSVPSGLPSHGSGSLRMLLRGIGGAHHGHGLSLEHPRRIGSASTADLFLEGDGIAAQHAIIEIAGTQVVLRGCTSPVLVNGHHVQQAVLNAGDQIVFAAQHRFVLEGTMALAAEPPCTRGMHAALADAPPTPAASGWAARIPWLLVAALLMAGSLSALLMFGAR